MRKLVNGIVVFVVGISLAVLVARRGEKPSPAALPEPAAPAATQTQAPRPTETAEKPRIPQDAASSTVIERADAVKKVTIGNPFGSVQVTGGGGGISVKTRAYMRDKSPLPKRLPVEVKEETTPEGEYRVEVTPVEDTNLLDAIVMNLTVSVPPNLPQRSR